MKIAQKNIFQMEIKNMKIEFFWDKEGKRHYERRYYDESGKIISEEIENKQRNHKIRFRKIIKNIMK